MMKQGLCIVAAACMGALLFSACARQTVWETIGDDCCGAPEAAGYEIAVELPDDAVEEVFSDRGSKRLYAQPGGGYEITTQVLSAATQEQAVRQLSGFDQQALHVYEGTSDGRPVWQFAWYAASDEGGRMYRCKVISDGSYCYALTVSVPEGAGTSYDTMLTEVFSSMELQPV